MKSRLAGVFVGLALLADLTFGVFAQNANNPTSAMAVPGQLPGTGTNDSASAGNVGEIVVSGASANAQQLSSATVTYTIATPGVVNWTTNPYFAAFATGNGCGSIFVPSATTGSLPTGLTLNTPVYVTCDSSLTANAFHVSSSVANAIAGTALAFTGSQSGTQTGANIAPLTSATALDFGGMSLTPGDWDVEATVSFSAGSTTAITNYGLAVGLNSGSLGNHIAFFSDTFASEVPGAANINRMAIPERLSLSSTTTVYCDVRSSFTVSSMAASGFCRARRVR